MEAETASEEHPHKKARHRMKQVFISIQKQMEFYFSDSNLSKDRFLGQILKESPHVDLNVFLEFNKIRKLTTNIEDLRKALKHSDLIELSEDGSKVSRKEPFKQKLNVDESTIYVERLKSDATHEWLSSVFSEFGKVVYVSIPKYKHSNNIKGFAFIEFDNEKETQNALSYFESIGAKMPSDVEPHELCSIKTFQEKEEEISKEMNVDGTDEESKKRKLDESSKIESDNHKKLKMDEDNHEVSEADMESEHKKKKKLKKEHKKRNYIKELGLQVLSKCEWKKMRNRYLTLQYKKMKEFKQHLNRVKFSQQNYDEKVKKPETITNTEEISPPKLDFIEGVIVKIEYAEPFQDPKKVKNEIKVASSDVKFVDLSAASCQEVIVRFGTSKGAKDFASSDFNVTKRILEGDEEKLYWDKILQDRDAKFKKTAKKQRGREKLLKKANKLMASHIKFDD